jgi:large subunit ribosomal protein L27
MAHKKAAWSTKNLRDSNPKYRWVKLFGGQIAKAGNIIVRQKWSKYVAWENTYMWKDFTIHAKINGIVKYTRKKIEKFNGRKYEKTIVNVMPIN